MTNENVTIGPMETDKKIRRRANVSRTSKGHSVEVTVEITGDHTREELLEELRGFFADVDAAYPREFRV